MRLREPLRTSWVGGSPGPTLGGVFQPLDDDLTAISALNTTSFGRGLLTAADAAAARTAIGAGTSSFDGAFASLSGKPTTVAGYGITDFNSLGDVRWQATDGDLTALAALTGTGIIYYRSAANMWSPVTFGPSMSFKSGQIKVTQYSSQLSPTPDATIPSAATLVLTGQNGNQVDVTGNTGITAITLADGEEVIVRFTGTPSITSGASLVTPGGANIEVTAGGFARVRGGAGGVVTVLTYQDANDYSRQTFGDIFMRSDANVGFDPDAVTPRFTIGSFDPVTWGVGGSYWMLTAGGNPTLVSQDDFGIQANFRLTPLTSSQIYLYPDVSGIFPVMEGSAGGIARLSVSSLIVDRFFTFPDHNGTFATQAGTESLTNKKLGDLTTNGLVRTSNSDGTLSVDTATYLTSSTGQPLDATLTALAALTIAANSLSIGTGADAFSQTTFAANTFPARASTGNLVAKAITDFGLSLVDDADASTMRTTLGLGTLATQSGTFSGTSSGTNTGDQTITLTGDVTGSGTGSFATTIGAGIVTFAMLATAAWENGDVTATADPDHVLPTVTALLFFIDATVGPMNVAISDANTAAFAALPKAGGTMTGQLVASTGSASAGSAPIKLVSGTVMTTPVAGTIEFTTDTLFFTKTTGPTRTSVATCPSAGPITFAGPTAARIITVPNAACTMARTDTAQTFTGVQTFGAQVRLKTYTVAGLPAGTQGDTAMATDLLAPTYLAAAVGGGAVVGTVQYNGAGWVCG